MVDDRSMYIVLTIILLRLRPLLDLSFYIIFIARSLALLFGCNVIVKYIFIFHSNDLSQHVETYFLTTGHIM